MHLLPKLILAALMVFPIGIATAQTTEDSEKRMILSVNSGSSLSQGLAMDIGKQLHERGEEVRIVLCARGAALAREGYEGPTLPGRDTSSQGLMRELMDQGVRIEVCDYALTDEAQAAGGDLIEGIAVADPEELGRFWWGATRVAAF